jgi:glutaredoxin
MEPALVITREDCPWCVRLKRELEMDGIDYEEVPVEKAKENRMWSEEWTTVPQLYLNNRWVGGYTEYIDFKNQETKLDNQEQNDYSDCAACEA